MRSIFIAAVLVTVLASVNAMYLNDPPDVADILNKLGLSSSKEVALAEKLDDEANDDALATVMTKALLRDLLDDDDDEEDSIRAEMMESSEEEASAQLHFLLPFAFRFVRGLIRRRVCRG